MAKWQNDLILDAALNYVKSNGTQVCLCTAQPTTYTQATSTYKIAIKTGLTSSDFTLADGDVSGRKLTVAAQSNVTVDTPGTATHIAVCSGSVLLFVTTCTSKAISGDLVNIPAFDYEIEDVTA